MENVVIHVVVEGETNPILFGEKENGDFLVLRKRLTFFFAIFFASRKTGVAENDLDMLTIRRQCGSRKIINITKLSFFSGENRKNICQKRTKNPLKYVKIRKNIPTTSTAFF